MALVDSLRKDHFLSIHYDGNEIHGVFSSNLRFKQANQLKVRPHIVDLVNKAVAAGVTPIAVPGFDFQRNSYLEFEDCQARVAVRQRGYFRQLYGNHWNHPTEYSRRTALDNAESTHNHNLKVFA